jgi:hypothetical protein
MDNFNQQVYSLTMVGLSIYNQAQQLLSTIFELEMNLIFEQEDETIYFLMEENVAFLKLVLNSRLQHPTQSLRHVCILRSGFQFIRDKPEHFFHEDRIPAILKELNSCPSLDEFDEKFSDYDYTNFTPPLKVPSSHWWWKKN